MKLEGAKKIEIQVWADLDLSHDCGETTDRVLKLIEREMRRAISEAVNSLESENSWFREVDWEAGTDLEGG